MALPVRSLLKKWNSDRLNPGVDLRAELEALARKDAELQGFIISGIGSLESPCFALAAGWMGCPPTVPPCHGTRIRRTMELLLACPES